MTIQMIQSSMLSSMSRVARDIFYFFLQSRQCNIIESIFKYSQFVVIDCDRSVNKVFPYILVRFILFVAISD